MLNQNWTDQWERVKRRLSDVRSVYTGAAGGTVWALDSVQSFFEAVHHMKDWLGNDASVAVTKADGDALINNSATLQLCADLANGSKHLALTTSRTGDPSTDITRNDATVLLGTGGLSKHAFYIASGGVEHSVLDVAEAAVTEWEGFLRGRHLI